MALSTLLQGFCLFVWLVWFLFTLFLGFAVWFLLSSLGTRWIPALGTLLCLVPHGSRYIYGPRGFKFITRLSCDLADLLA